MYLQTYVLTDIHRCSHTWMLICQEMRKILVGRQEKAFIVLGIEFANKTLLLSCDSSC